MKTKILSDGLGFTATDGTGFRRTVIHSNESKETGLVALQFTRKGQDAGEFEIQAKSSMRSRTFLKLEPGKGTLVLRPDLFERTAKLFDEPSFNSPKDAPPTTE